MVDLYDEVLRKAILYLLSEKNMTADEIKAEVGLDKSFDLAPMMGVLEVEHFVHEIDMKGLVYDPVRGTSYENIVFGLLAE